MFGAEPLGEGDRLRRRGRIGPQGEIDLMGRRRAQAATACNGAAGRWRAPTERPRIMARPLEPAACNAHVRAMGYATTEAARAKLVPGADLAAAGRPGLTAVKAV